MWKRINSFLVCVTTCFRRDVNDVVVLLGCYSVLTDIYRRLNRAYLFHLQRSSAWPLNIEQIGCPETSVTLNQHWVTSQKGEDVLCFAIANICMLIWFCNGGVCKEYHLPGCDYETYARDSQTYRKKVLTLSSLENQASLLPWWWKNSFLRNFSTFPLVYAALRARSLYFSMGYYVCLF